MKFTGNFGGSVQTKPVLGQIESGVHLMPRPRLLPALGSPVGFQMGGG